MKRITLLLISIVFVLSGCSPETEQAAEAAPTPTTPCVAPDCIEVAVDGLDYAFNPPDFSVRPGKVRFVLRNVGKKVHNLVVIGGNVEARTPNLAPSALGFVDVTLEARRYDVFCSITGHAERGMRGSLTVRP
ncbi:MAG: plastocyanin/azurin family copper-binding protein [Dehalococcoidia bacterium]